MSSSPYQSPVSDPVAPDAEVETISGSKSWPLKSSAVRSLFLAIPFFNMVHSLGGVASFKSAILSKYRHEYVYGGLSLLVLFYLLSLLTASRTFRRMEARMRQLLVSPGDTAVRQIGMASQGLPLLAGALVLTGSELIFYHRPWFRYVEKRRIPLAEIAAVRSQKSIPLPKLVLTLSSGRILKFRVLDGERWRDAILEVLDKA